MLAAGVCLLLFPDCGLSSTSQACMEYSVHNKPCKIEPLARPLYTSNFQVALKAASTLVTTTLVVGAGAAGAVLYCNARGMHHPAVSIYTDVEGPVNR